MQDYLFSQKLEVPVKVFSGKLYVRISAHLYNTLDEYKILSDLVLSLTHE